MEGIDLAPTFIEYFGGTYKPHVIEGRSLEPLLRGEKPDWRLYCVSEYDYATRDSRRAVGVDQNDARMVMIFDGRWKYIHVEKMRPMLFDLLTDPDEVEDLAADPNYAEQVDRLRELHFEWSRQHHNRTTLGAEIIEKMTDGKEPPGILIGFANREELEQHRGGKLPPHTKR